jgi:hypothetical protein
LGLDERRRARLSLLPSWAVRIGAPVSGGARKIRVASTKPPIGLLGDSDSLWIRLSDGWRVFYYVRVIEIPKPRWTAYDRRYFESEMDDSVPMTTQDRAYTSPIWYTP